MLPGDRPGDKVIGIARRTPTVGLEVRVRTFIGGDKPGRHIMVTPVFLDDKDYWREQTPAKDQRKGISFRAGMLDDMIGLLALAQQVVDDQETAIGSRAAA